MSEPAAGGLLERACAVYRGVVTDPGLFGTQASRLVHEARHARHPESLVVALRAEAWAERSRLADRRAKELLDEAARIARRHGLSVRLGEVLTSRGAVNLELGRIPAARRDLERATALVRDGRSADLLLQQAVLLHNVGRLSEAAGLYRQVLADARASPETRAKVANNLALIEVVHGRVDAAFAALEEAARAAARAGPAPVAFVAQSWGWVAVQAGRLVEGLRRFDEALALYERAGLPLAEHYLEYIDALVDLRLLPEAVATSRRAMEVFARSDVPLMAAEAHWRLARLALLSGDLTSAAVAADRAAASFRAQRRPAWTAQAELVGIEARTRTGPVAAGDVTAMRRVARTLGSRGLTAGAVEAHLSAGRLALRLDRPATALEELDRAWALARRAPVLQRLNGRVAAALAASVRGQDAQVLRHCRAGLADLDVHRAAFESMELRALASGHGAELGRMALRVAVRSATPARVLDWMERTRAAAFVAVEPQPAGGIDDQLAELRAAHAELDRATDRDAAGHQELQSRVSALEHRVRRATWSQHGAPGRTTAPVAAPALRRLLAGRVLVEYGQLDGELYVSVLDPHRTRLVRLTPLAGVAHEAEAVLFALRRLASGTSAATEGLARRAAEVGLGRLREMLIEPLRLPADRELVVVPASALWRVPWAALHRAPVTVAPSASQWARTLAHTGAGTVPSTLLVAGPGLPGALREVSALRELHERPTVLLPPESTVTEVAARLAGADLVHLACHSRLRADNPAFSALLLSDGPLSVHEIELRGLAPRRVVLAACDSAADVAYEGNEMLGFVSALFARGTTGLVASVVPVPDLDAVPLMRGLHEQLRRGERMAPALHAARTAMDRDDARSFANWCAFNAFGGG